jgi:excisionase family DNA binding protein
VQRKQGISAFLDGRAPACYQNGVPDLTAGAMVDTEDSLLNSKEVAAILDCSPDTVNELARKSILPAVKKGRQWRFRKREITSFKRQLRGTTAA